VYFCTANTSRDLNTETLRSRWLWVYVNECVEVHLDI